MTHFDLDFKNGISLTSENEKVNSDVAQIVIEYEINLKKTDSEINRHVLRGLQDSPT